MLVHEERHYEKLNPILKSHKKELENKISEIWDFYNRIKEYKNNPTENEKKVLSDLFDTIFNVGSNYEELDKRLRLTYEKKDSLLTVLEYPTVAIHNNISENGVRPSVIKREISNGTRTNQGTNAWENHLSILATCKKQGVNYREYIKDIFMHKEHAKSLSALIREKAQA